MEKLIRFFIEMWQDKSTRNNMLILSAVLAILIVGIIQLSDDEDEGPCSEHVFPGSCYSVAQPICQTAWHVAESSCKDKMQDLLKPGRVAGPILLNCERSIYDRAFRYVRKSTPECTGHFEALEQWRKTNPDF